MDIVVWFRGLRYKENYLVRSEQQRAAGAPLQQALR